MATDRQQTPKTRAEPTVPGPREAGPEQPTTQPGAPQPDAVQPDAVQPDAVQPGAVQPGAVQPGAAQPGAVQPDAAQRAQPGAGTAAPGTSGTTTPPHHVLERTRISGVWVATACFVVFLVLLLIFIAQNSRTVDISYLGAHGHISLGVAMLVAAVCGALLVIFAGTARIMQLRATARKHRRADAKAAKAAR